MSENGDTTQAPQPSPFGVRNLLANNPLSTDSGKKNNFLNKLF
jgi:hypothetical protein